jgi:hypothetical protein
VICKDFALLVAAESATSRRGFLREIFSNVQGVLEAKQPSQGGMSSLRLSEHFLL